MDAVCILCRQDDEDQERCGLVLGVFSSADDAMAHARVRECLPVHAWQAPRPGKRRWRLSTGQHVFAIEEYPVREPCVAHFLDSSHLMLVDGGKS